MQTRAPSIGKVMIAVGFALSCFALLVFLWVTFGGTVPLKPSSYKFTADFPEAITLQKEADVRVAGVSVGKVKDLELPEEGNATRAVIEIEERYAPIPRDTRATLRQKTLLGETYVELTTGGADEGVPLDDETAQTGAVDVGELSGDDAPEPIEEGGHLEDTQVQEQVQIDEIFNALDEETRQSFQLWMRNSAIAVDGQGLSLNDAFGNIGPFSADASDVLGTLRRQEDALRTVVRETGAVFEALTAREQELAGAIVGSNRTFRALASRDRELAETFQILPTFEMESRLTLERLERFAANAQPLMEDLKPVARDLSPTLRDLRRLAPNARRLFKNLDPLIKAGRSGIPAMRDFFDELRPVMVSLDPFLANFNPILRYLDYGAPIATDFLANPAAATAGILPPIAGQPGPRHMSRQMGNINYETLSIWPERARPNRGNGYLQPFAIGNPFSASQGELFPNHDCDNTGASGGLGSGQVTSSPPSNPPPQEGVFPASSQTATAVIPGVSAFVPCTLASDWPAAFGGTRQPIVEADPPYNALP